MSGETLIRIIEDVILEDGCTNTWDFHVKESAIPSYYCRKHHTEVPLSGPCPKSEFWARRGETVSVPSKVARRLVESELAEFPTHTPEPDQGVQDTLGRVNALMEAQGLPHLNAEAMGVWKIEGRQDAYQRPAKPRDRRLASDLGLDAGDIAAMRKLAKGEN
jgi:hypothetical protein